VLDAENRPRDLQRRSAAWATRSRRHPGRIDGKIFFLSEGRAHVVIEAGDKYVELAKNDLGEMSLATPALAPDACSCGRLTKLYRIAGK
jgi:hypothetical protein